MFCRHDRRRPSNRRKARIVTAAWLACSCLLATQAKAAGESYRFAAVADWVEVVSLPQAVSAPLDGGSESAAFLLFDRQIGISDKGDDYHQRVVVQALNAEGVDVFSQVNVSVDPSYQTLDLHWLRVIRGGVVLDEQPTAQITELAEETDLSRRIYNGRVNVNILLRDVRAGDVVDYAYTVHSREFLYPGHYAARLDMGWSQPMRSARVRVRAPLDRALHFRASDGSAAPTPTVRAGMREWQLERQNVPATTVEASTPSWYSPWPYVEISDLESWATVSRLVLPMYERRSRNTAGLQTVAERIRQRGGGTKELALHALQFVQEEIRYTSISIGRGSHEPTSPAEVIGRRFGDCKDKALLLTTLLAELGVDARVALVNSERRRALDAQLPTPYAFDHAIVRARIDGQSYWLDATASTQYEPLSPARSVAFERALVLERDTRALEPIPPSAPSTRSRDVRVEWDLREGIESPATLKIVSSYRGELAEIMRPVVASINPAQRQTNYENYIARWYPNARALEPVAIADDHDNNVLEVTERYGVPAAFTPDGKGLLKFVLHADELYSYMEPLGAGARRAPLAQEYPISIRQHIVALLPDPWPVEAKTVTVDNPAFRYRSAVSYKAETLDLDYAYQALAPYTPVDMVDRYEADRARVYDDLGYVLTFNPRLADAASTFAPLPTLLVLLALGFSIWGMVRLYRFDPSPRPVSPAAPVGIAGWLLPVALGVLLTPFVLAWTTYAYGLFLKLDLWETLPTLVDDASKSSAQLVVTLILCGSIALLALSVLTTVLFFRKRSSAPTMYLALTWLALVWGAAAQIWASASGFDDETNPAKLAASLVRDTFAAAIWSAYILASRRVAATFVERYGSRAATPTATRHETATAG